MTRTIPGASLAIGDAILFLGRAHRVTRIIPYTGALLDTGAYPAGTRIAYSDDGSARPWGMTIPADATIEVVS